MKQDKIPTNQKYCVNLTTVSNTQKSFMKCGKNATKRAGKGKLITSFFYKEQCHSLNVEVLRRMMFPFKKKIFFFMMVVFMKIEEDGARGWYK